MKTTKKVSTPPKPRVAVIPASPMPDRLTPDERLTRNETILANVQIDVQNFIRESREQRDANHRESNQKYADLGLQITALANKFSDSGKTNWGLIISMISVIIVLIGGGFVVVKLTVSTELAPIASDARVSVSDRAGMHNDLTALSKTSNELIHELGMLKTSTSEKLKEVETQFRAMAQLNNQSRGFNQQIMGLMWKKVFEDTLPPATFYPDISQPK